MQGDIRAVPHVRVKKAYCCLKEFQLKYAKHTCITYVYTWDTYTYIHMYIYEKYDSNFWNDASTSRSRATAVTQRSRTPQQTQRLYL